MNQEEKLKERIIESVQTLNTQNLKSVEAFITTLETKQSTIQNILSFSGAWNDLEEDIFLDLTRNLPTERKKGEDRIL